MVSRRRRPVELVTLILVVVLGVSLLVGLGRKTGAGFDGSGRVVIQNVSLVLTMDPKLGEGPLGWLEDADVLIDGDRISAVGKDLPDDGAQVLDGHGKIVLPGFVNLHNHLWQALIRGCATDQDLRGWLSGCWPTSDTPPRPLARHVRTDTYRNDKRDPYPRLGRSQNVGSRNCWALTPSPAIGELPSSRRGRAHLVQIAQLLLRTLLVVAAPARALQVAHVVMPIRTGG